MKVRLITILRSIAVAYITWYLLKLAFTTRGAPESVAANVLWAVLMLQPHIAGCKKQRQELGQGQNEVST